MKKIKYEVEAPLLGEYDVVVCGGGIAGFGAAVSAARQGMKVALIEKGGYLGGTMTQGLIPHFIDGANKGGIVKEMLDSLNLRQWTCPRTGKRVDENGEKIPGFLLDTEGAKYYFDETCTLLNIELFYYSRLCTVNKEDRKIESLLISSDGGNFSVKGKVYIDATGNGDLAAMCGCRYECGEPETGVIQSMSMNCVVAGYPEHIDGVDSEEEKTAYHRMLEKYNVTTSGGQAGLVKLPTLQTWVSSGNYEYNIHTDDIKAITKATIRGRKEVMDTIMKHSRIPGYEKMAVVQTSDHIGVREGRRIYGQYRITLDDALEGKKFDDGICIVKFGVDVHKLHKDDTLDNKRGIRTKPYNIPYRSLIPLDVDNMLLAGRCISGDFYPHASYRVMGNMAATGEAAGYAAFLCVKETRLPKELDGKRISKFMEERGYDI